MKRATDRLVQAPCPMCGGLIEYPASRMGEAVDCPLCQKYIKLPFVPTEFGKKFIKVSEAMQIPVGCVGILIGLVVWLFCFGLIVVAAIMFVTFVLTKLGIMRVNN